MMHEYCGFLFCIIEPLMETCFVVDYGKEGIQPYILGDKAYPSLVLVDDAPKVNWGATYCS